MEALGDFFYQISIKKKENFNLVTEFCSGKSNALLEKLNGRLMEIAVAFETVQKLSPTKSMGWLDSRQLSQNSGIEEERSDQMMMMDGMSLAPTSSVKQPSIKLLEEDEKHLKQMMRLNDDSEVLFRIFKLLN